MVKKLRTYGLPEYRTFHKVPHKDELSNKEAKAHCDEIINEVKIQEKEHPWLTRTQLYRLANDHVNIKHSGGKSHG